MTEKELDRLAEELHTARRDFVLFKDRIATGKDYPESDYRLARRRFVTALFEWEQRKDFIAEHMRGWHRRAE